MCRPARLSLFLAWLCVAAAVPAQTTVPLRNGVRVPPPTEPLSELAAKRWTVDDGLLANIVLDTLQTRDGFLWIASYEGLTRFDGMSFHHLSRKDLGLSASGIRSLTESPDGRLWMGAQGGVALSRELGSTFTVRSNTPLPHMITSLVVDENGVTWMGTEDGGLFLLRNGTLEPPLDPRLVGVTVQTVLRDESGAIWLATNGEGVFRIAGDDVHHLTTADGLPSGIADGLALGADGAVWIGTSEGLARWHEGTIEVVEHPLFRQIGPVREDTNGNLWIGTENRLLRRNGETGEVESLEAIGQTSIGGVGSFSFDNEGGVWVATFSAGLVRLAAPRLQTLTPAPGLAKSKVYAVGATHNGILVGFVDGDVQRVKGRRFEPFQLAKPHDSRIRLIFEDSRGRTWIGSSRGLTLLDGDQERFLTNADGLPDNRVRVVFEDSRNRIWIGTANGMARLENDQIVTTHEKIGGLSSFIMSIDEDLQGRLIIGVRGALARFEKSGETHVWGAGGPETATTLSIPGTVVFNTWVDPADGKVWIATNGGLAQLAPDDTLARLTAAHGLPNETLFDLLPDTTGHLWMCSPVGLLRAHRDDIQAVFDGRREEIDIQHFNELDGMSKHACTGPASSVSTADGRLLFPTEDGLVVAVPERLRSNPVPPPVDITRFNANNENRLLHQGHDLPPGSRNMSIHFAAPTFEIPERARLRYRLDGFDDEWQDAGFERSKVYSSLPHGIYTFRLQAENGDGVGDGREATLSFQVLPTLFERPAFYVALALLLLGAFSGGYRFMRQRQTRLEGLVAQLQQAEHDRERLVAELQTKNEEIQRFTYKVSHDLRNPLVTIKGFLGYVKEDAEAEHLQKDLAIIENAANVMNRRLDGLLRISQVGTGRDPLVEVSLVDVAREAADLVGGEIRAGHVEVWIDPTLPKVVAERDRMLEVYQNLIGNAVKFMDDTEDPFVELGWRQEAHGPVFFVRDNGRGIDPSQQKMIFDLFHRVDKNVEGTGIGLATVQRIVEVHQGRIWVESTGLGDGATFCWTLPQES